MKKSNEVVGKGKTELVRQQTKGRSGRAGPIPIHSPRVIEQSKPASDRHRRSRGGTIRSWMADIILPTEGDGARGALRVCTSPAKKRSTARNLSTTARGKDEQGYSWLPAPTTSLVAAGSAGHAPIEEVQTGG